MTADPKGRGKVSTRRGRSFDDRAEVGIGTLIVFIAMILVAAVAAAVLIQTSGMLQQRAQDTGQQALTQTSTNFEVTGVYGSRVNDTGATQDDIVNVTMHVQLRPGATEMDLSKLTIRYSDGSILRNNLAWSESADASYFDADANFTITILRDVAGMYQASAPVIGQGDLVEIKIYNVALPTRTNVQVALSPETGSGVDINFRTPNTYGTSKFVQLK